MNSFQEISESKIQNIISIVESSLDDCIDIDIIENGLIYFYSCKNNNDHCVLSINHYNKEIWFSSPDIGPSHWALTDDKKWFDKRNNRYNLEELVISALKYL